MKNLKLIGFLMILASSLMLIQCTNEYTPIPGPAGADGSNGVDGTDGVSTGAGESTTELLAMYTFLGPVVDGVIDASWADAQILTGTATVPDPKSSTGVQVFRGYVGYTNDFTLRAQYDDDYIYFLAQWKDYELDGARDTWYFDAASSLWKQESNKPVFASDTDDTIVRDAFYEDKFGMQWNISSTNNWGAGTCYATCHTGADDAANDINGGGAHYTTVAGEQTDMWHWKSVRTGIPTGQFDDKHIVFPDASHLIAGGKTRAGDTKISGGHSNNKQTLALDGTGANVSVPKYYIPGKTNYNWILVSEVTDGTAVLITGVHTDGKLDLAGGGIIDPVADTDYQRPQPESDFKHTTAPKGMPSITTEAFVGSRGDITCGQTYTGNGWILEFKRKLNTGNADDVQFDTTKEYPFGLGVFDNAAIAHAIKPGLNLKFEQ